MNLFEIKENVGVITLNRPKVYNSFNREMALAMQASSFLSHPKVLRVAFVTGTKSKSQTMAT